MRTPSEERALKAQRAAAARERRRTQSEEQREAEREARRRRREDPAVRQREADAIRRRRADPEWKKRAAEAQKRRCEDVEIRLREAEAQRPRRFHMCLGDASARRLQLPVNDVECVEVSLNPFDIACDMCDNKLTESDEVHARAQQDALSGSEYSGESKNVEVFAKSKS